jgi:ABC-2 type transport system ATP-binding protein
VTALTEVVRALDEAGITAEDIALRRPTLDEVFLHLTGHRADTSGEEVAA